MSITADIYNGFSAKLEAFAQTYSPAIPIGYIGIDFVPPKSGIWLLVSSVMSSATDLGMEVGADFTETGTHNIMVYSREGEGIEGILDMAEDVRDAFTKRSTFGTAYVTDTPSIRGPVKDDRLAAMLVPVRIDWRVVR